MTDLQNSLSFKEARKRFDFYPSDQGVWLKCSAQNIKGEYFADVSVNGVNDGYVNRLTEAKTRFYMDTLQKVLGRVPEQQKFFFDLVPDVQGRPDPRDYSWLADIMATFNGPTSKPRVNLGIVEWCDGQSVAAIAQFSFRDAAAAAHFKLTYC